MTRHTSILSLGLLLALAACQSQTPLPSTPANLPDQSNDSIHVFKKTKVSWSDTDYKEVEYDAANVPIRYTTQNLYIQNTNQVRKVIYNFLYTTNRLTRLEASNGSYVTYTYDGNNVRLTQEFAPNGQLATTYTYQYSADNKLTRVDITQGEGPNKTETARTFAYDAKGNLTQLVDLSKDDQTGGYREELVTRFTGYDSHKNVSNLWTLYPFLPNVTFQVNNPSTITQFTKGPDGKEMQIHQSVYTYQYNSQKYPTAHTQTDAGGTLTAAYSYVGLN
ncbi:hypothetical protein [Spirosoma aerolatum]|uniref:hypothetical protein n=1 Tax=Spirosoma aerolatum TaxID=1211326 RepID=UPI0009AEB0BB|nr:hypothetical protein [Spirosoma aerolatum]